MNLVEYQRAVVRVSFDLEPSESDLALLGDEPRWRMYREMVRNRLEGMARIAFRQSVEAVGQFAFEASFARFLAGGGAKSALIRDVVAAFGAFARGDAELLSGAPSALADQLAFEQAKWEAAYVPAVYPVLGEGGVRELDFDGKPVLNPVLRTLSMPRALLPDCGLDSAPGSDDRFWLLVYRPPAVSAVRWWAVSAFFARLLEHFALRADTVADAVRTVAAEQARAVDADLLDELATDLTLAVQRGVLLGVRD